MVLYFHKSRTKAQLVSLVSDKAVAFGKKLFPLFALALGLPEDFFDDKVSYYHSAGVDSDMIFGLRSKNALLSCASYDIRLNSGLSTTESLELEHTPSEPFPY